MCDGDEKMKIKKSKEILIGIGIAIMILITAFIPVLSLENQFDVHGEKGLLDDLYKSRITIFSSGFESWTEKVPDEFISNTGWLEDYYGGPHNGSHWAYSWSAGDTITTPVITFGNDTELSFWYCAEKATNPMSLEVYIDTINLSHMIWNDSSFSHTSYENAIINLSDYSSDHQILFVGMTSDMYGLLLDDVLLTSHMVEKSVQNVDTGEYFDTIQKAIDDDDTKDGDIIEVSNGTYYENINVNKQLTIQAASTPVIDAMGGVAITIKIENVVIDGFTIINASKGIVCNAPGFTLQHNHITSSNDAISFVKNELGVSWVGDETVTVKQTRILNNEITSGADGIYWETINWGNNMRGSALMQVGAFIIHGNTITAQSYGIDAYGIKWWGNTMSGNALFSFEGLYVTNNTITAGLGGYGDGIEWDDIWMIGKGMYDNACFILGDICFSNNTITCEDTGIEIYYCREFGFNMYGSSSFLWNGNFLVMDNTIQSQESEGMRLEYIGHFGNHMNDSSSFVMQDIIIAGNDVVSTGDDGVSFDSFEEYGYYMGEASSFSMGSIYIKDNTFVTYDNTSYGVNFYEFDTFGRYMYATSTFAMEDIVIKDNTVIGEEQGWEDINYNYFGSNMYNEAVFTMGDIMIVGNTITSRLMALEIDEISDIGYNVFDSASCHTGDIIIADNILTSSEEHGLYIDEFDSLGRYLYNDSMVTIGDIRIFNNTVNAGDEQGYGICVEDIRYIGIDLHGTSEFSIGEIQLFDNKVTSCFWGINITYAYLIGYNVDPTALCTIGNITIFTNMITSCDTGLALLNEYNITVTENIIEQCLLGIYITGNDSLLYNNLLNNTNNAYDSGFNSWNITKTPGTNILGGPYLGGNYWSDYTGEDTNGDGLGDTQLPYTSSGNIMHLGDYHPLIKAQISNNPPDIIELYPEQGSSMISRPPVELNATIADIDGDMMTITLRFINNTPIDHNWETIIILSDIVNGTYNYSIPLSTTWIWGNTSYTWSLNVTDGVTWTNETLTFTTGGSRYDVTNDNKVNYFDALTTWIHRTNNPSNFSYDGLYDVNDDNKINYNDALTVWANRGI